MSNQQNIIFGTDGWRAKLGQAGINRQSVAIVAQAFADYCQQNAISKVVIGYDGRLKSADFAALFADVLHANQIKVLLSHCIVPTPVVSFHCARLGAAGVMITASHNPAEYNGIKFKSTAGSPFYTEETARIEALLGLNQVRTTNLRHETTDLLLPYLSHLETMFDFSKIRSSGLKVAVDSMHGAGTRLIEKLLQKHGIEAETIAAEPLPDFGGRLAEPIAANLTPLTQFVSGNNFSIGLATDGDADRLGVVDNHGNYVNIQEIILALAAYTQHHRNGQGPLVKTASVTDKLLKLAPPGQIIDVQVGFKYVAEAMMQHKASFGAEESGGFGFGCHLPERDGIFSGLMMLEMMAASAYVKLSEMLDDQRLKLGAICYDRIDWHNNDENRHTVLTRLVNRPPASVAGFSVAALKEFYNSHNIINGLKIRLEGPERWLLLRVSETEPMVRIYAEGQNKEEVNKLLEAGKMLFETMQKEKTPL
ncbi:MAG TPA: phosphoglucomutase [Bacteroidales bacterium]|nr:phosphoglucomutase [Bacteroidales bacterium]